jgi:hypothetical protein
MPLQQGVWFEQQAARTQVLTPVRRLGLQSDSQSNQGCLLPSRERWATRLLALHDSQLLAEQQYLQVFFFVRKATNSHQIQDERSTTPVGFGKTC